MFQWYSNSRTVCVYLRTLLNLSTKCSFYLKRLICFLEFSPMCQMHNWCHILGKTSRIALAIASHWSVINFIRCLHSIGFKKVFNKYINGSGVLFFKKSHPKITFLQRLSMPTKSPQFMPYLLVWYVVSCTKRSLNSYSLFLFVHLFRRFYIMMNSDQPQKIII